jgi:hypothetical protein
MMKEAKVGAVKRHPQNSGSTVMSVFFPLLRRSPGALAALLLFVPSVRADDPKAPPSPVVPPQVDLSIRTSPYRPMVGNAATVTATIKAPDTTKKRAVAGLFFVREDVGQLFFDEPTRKDDGTFEDTITLPSGGEWRVFGNVVTEVNADKGDTAETITGPIKLTVDGVRAVREPLIPQVTPTIRNSNYSLTLKQPTRIMADDSQALVFTLLDAQAQQVSDTDIWRGALAHLVLVDKDAKTLLHVTPDTTDPRTGRTGTLVFPARLPKAGIWRGWVLFRRNGQIVNLPIVLRVSGR